MTKPSKTKLIIAITILVAAFIAGGFFAYNSLRGGSKEISDSAEVELNTETVEEDDELGERETCESAVFNIDEVQVGDRIGCLTVSSIEPISEGAPMKSDYREGVGYIYNMRIKFEGQITARGNFWDGRDGMPGSICFRTTENYKNEFPRLDSSKEPEEGAVFCFEPGNHHDYVMQYIEQAKGVDLSSEYVDDVYPEEVAVVVEDYTFDAGFATELLTPGSPPTAKLVEIIE